MNLSESYESYDALAEHFREYSETKKNYLQKVDECIIQNSPSQVNSLLDVGAGDGVRGIGIAHRLNARRIVLTEPSKKMFSLCKQHTAAELWNCEAASMPLNQGKFDVILCLWNVLGHMPNNHARHSALKRMASLLADGGKLFIDVNNRYNAPAYGWVRVPLRMIVDALMPDESRGDANFDWRIGGKKIPAMGHVFTPAEMKRLFTGVDFQVLKRQNIDYQTGKYSKFPFVGQFLYITTVLNGKRKEI